MTTAAVIQARMGSTRLPGKTLMVAAGKPLLAHLVERLQRARTLDRVIVATTTNPEDDEIERLCATVGAGCFRGSSEDVLGRVAAALQAFGVDVHVEVHGDGPLADWRLVDHAVDRFEDGGVDLVTNAKKVTYPPGLEVWVYRSAVAVRLSGSLTAPEYRDSPVLYLMQHPDEFVTVNIEAPPALHAPDTYLEVDEAVDFEVLRWILDRLYPRNPAFVTEDVLTLLREHPELAERNRGVVRRWKEQSVTP